VTSQSSTTADTTKLDPKLAGKQTAPRGSASPAGLAATVAVALILTGVSAPAYAAPTVDKGDTAFLILSTALVLMMSVPGLALFYAGLVRTRNVIGVLLQVFVTVCLVCVVWMVIGYSLAFSGGPLAGLVGGTSKAFLLGVTPASRAATFSHGVYLPELAYVWFQMTFAAITTALIVGAFVERMKFAALSAFVVLWTILVYCPIAHMVWYWPGPDALAAAAGALAAASPADRPAAQAALDAVMSDAGVIYRWGALDFAGGTVVHVNAGIAGLVAALVIGPRRGYGREPMPPHSLTLSMVGASLLWVGWFGFNCGSTLEANGTAALAMGNTVLAAAAAALAWIAVEWGVTGKPRLLGATTGAVAGLVAVTPAAGFAGPVGALVLGLAVSPVCYVFCTTIKAALGYDDTLDVFGVHGIAGILGALGTGLVVAPVFGGTGVPDYLTRPGEIVTDYDMATQMLAQGAAVGVTLVWSGGATAVILAAVSLTIGLRVPPEAEARGLDVSAHGESGYNY
jgi:Amt family ammonium transporter